MAEIITAVQEASEVKEEDENMDILLSTKFL